MMSNVSNCITIACAILFTLTSSLSLFDKCSIISIQLIIWSMCRFSQLLTFYKLLCAGLAVVILIDPLIIRINKPNNISRLNASQYPTSYTLLNVKHYSIPTFTNFESCALSVNKPNDFLYCNTNSEVSSIIWNIQRIFFNESQRYLIYNIKHSCYVASVSNKVICVNIKHLSRKLHNVWWELQPRFKKVKCRPRKDLFIGHYPATIRNVNDKSLLKVNGIYNGVGQYIVKKSKYHDSFTLWNIEIVSISSIFRTSLINGLRILWRLIIYECVLIFYNLNTLLESWYWLETITNQWLTISTGMYIIFSFVKNKSSGDFHDMANYFILTALVINMLKNDNLQSSANRSLLTLRINTLICVDIVNTMLIKRCKYFDFYFVFLF
ncbi:hypothetical protein GJ496_006797 [Pomphorhynchus laevis]|nr:hypothetical protein GJ496_006797 [Pomphorhynchus laevis]